MGIIISVCAAKGGVGRTSTTLALAAEFATHGHAVIVSDLDPQASSTSALHLDTVEPTQSPLLLPPVPAATLAFIGGRLDVSRGGRWLEQAGEQVIRRHLATLRERADVVLLDTMPSLGPSVRAALMESDLVLGVAEPTWLAVRGLSEIVAAARVLVPRARRRAVLTRYRGTLTLTREVEALLAWEHPGLCYPVHIPQDVRVAESPAHGVPVTAYRPSCRAARAYAALARLIAADVGLLVKEDRTHVA